MRGSANVSDYDNQSAMDEDDDEESSNTEDQNELSEFIA